MKIKSSLIIKYRKDRLWSQKHLSKVSGLGLGTIQRLESKGSCSLETIRSLASVFEINAETLFWSDSGFEKYKHKQWGVSILTSIIILATVILGINGWGKFLPIEPLSIILGILTMVAIIFSSMTIEVDVKDVSWYFGPGVFKNKISIEEITNCSNVKNPIWMGFGIHSFGTGWIYNVSGLLGVEIELNGGSFIRLGTNQPRYLTQAILNAKDYIDETNSSIRINSPYLE